MDIISSLVWIKRGAAKTTPIKFMPEKEELESMIDKSGDHADDEKSKDVDMERDEVDEQEDDEDNVLMPGVGPIAMHASNRDDPLLEIKDDGEDSDAEDYFIRPDDNLVIAAHIEDDTSSLEVYVYNDKEGYLYIHHDILMLNMPLCLTWLDYDANNANAVNYVAVGSMEGVIELFDIDLVDQMEPLHTFGKKSKKKKNKIIKKIFKNK
jgi:periodic tryptophan protein 1